MKIVHETAALRLMSLTDADLLYKIVEEHPEVWTYLTSKMDSRKDMDQYVNYTLSQYKQGVELPFVVEDQKTKEIVGSTRLYQISKENKTVELGHTWYHPKVQRTSINTECKYLLLKYAFEELGMIRVQIKTDLRNLKAQRAIERIGAVKEGVLRSERQLPDGYVRDAVVYSILEGEWPNVKKLLLEKLAKYKAVK
ncbi:RimJ/RimL family protein N-acetyltransferase [Scopulibacillus daqui]|uniref:RimJ/RimL family protein N-acetyltransferase n=1 Tax=Scopulibacillus daqui TaxID=1469162 RepID=A0ABS2PWZ9_9BACL|nr:GNAT family protein [Scopulibacillus daqui]MBM7644085.1 RimJ/RimL family protein N-acetyltransferase [Scopulibacillus daqui]